MAREATELTPMLTSPAQTEREPEKRRKRMARSKRYQKGSVQLHNRKWTLRYREGGVIKRVTLDEAKNAKQARKEADKIMARVNDTEKPTSELTFRQFFERRWKAYTVAQRYQPST